LKKKISLLSLQNSLSNLRIAPKIKLFEDFFC
jgi:hypothetical protein